MRCLNMENRDIHAQHAPTRRQRKGLIILPLLILLAVVVIFVGMNLSHKAEKDDSAANAAAVTR
jgi:hypothetical protein